MVNIRTFTLIKADFNLQNTYQYERIYLIQL